MYTGRQVNEASTTGEEIAVISNEMAQEEEQESNQEGLQSLSSPPPGGSIKTQPITQPAKQYSCGETDITPLILSKFPNPGYIISEMTKIQESGGYNLFIIQTQSTGTNNATEMWIYALGLDGIISNDDKVFYVGKLSEYRPHIGKIEGSDRLYWLEKDSATLDETIMSCALPVCSSKKREGKLPSGQWQVRDIIPSPTPTSRLYLAVTNKLTGSNLIVSCSLSNSAIDWCGGDNKAYQVHLTDIYGYGGVSVQNEGMTLNVHSSSNPQFFNIKTDTLVDLPSGAYLDSAVQSRSGEILMLTGQGSTIFELVNIDTSSGNSVVWDRFTTPIHGIYGYFIDFKKLTTIFKTYNGSQFEIYKKIIMQNHKLIYSGDSSNNKWFILYNGVVINIDEGRNKIKAYYDCTP